MYRRERDGIPTPALHRHSPRGRDRADDLGGAGGARGPTSARGAHRAVTDPGRAPRNFRAKQRSFVHHATSKERNHDHHHHTFRDQRRPADARPSLALLLGAFLVAVLLATASVTAGAAWAAAGGLPGTGDTSFNPAGNTEDNHCVSPEGVDANELLGISEQLVLPGVCDVVQAGEFYVFFNAVWDMNTSWEAVPADYTPSAPTPLQDFISKVRSMTFVVDPGTKHERSYRFTAQDIMDVRTIHDSTGGTR
jgi:hypothetical protein